MGKGKVKEYRYFQEFILFIKFEAKEDISKTRKNRAIESEKAFKTLQDLQENFEKNRDHKNKEYLKLVKERENIFGKFTVNESREMLRMFGKPSSWEFPLRWYVLTGKIIPPSSRCKVDIDGEQGIIRLSPEANIRDIKDIYKLVKQTQELLVGSDFKKKRIKKKLNEHLSIAKDYGAYKKIKRKTIEVRNDPLGSSNKAEKRLELVGKCKPKAVDSLEQQLKEEARQRQVYKRHKKYLTVHT